MFPFHTQVHERFAAQGRKSEAKAHDIVAHIIALHIEVVVIIESAEAIIDTLQIVAAVVGDVLHTAAHLPSVVEFGVGRLIVRHGSVFRFRPILIGEVDFGKEAISMGIAHTQAKGVGLLIFSFQIAVISGVDLGVAGGIVESGGSAAV